MYAEIVTRIAQIASGLVTLAPIAKSAFQRILPYLTKVKDAIIKGVKRIPEAIKKILGFVKKYPKATLAAAGLGVLAWRGKQIAQAATGLAKLLLVIFLIWVTYKILEDIK